MSQWWSDAVKHRDHSQVFEISITSLEVNGLTPFDSNYLQLHPGVQICLAHRGITTKELLKMGNSLPWFLLDLPLEALSMCWGERNLLPNFSECPKIKWEDFKKWLMIEGNKKSVMNFSPA